MPVKRSITWADVQVGEIKKTALKKEEEFSEEDLINRRMAILLASFSSCHSWQTHRCVTDGNNGFTAPEIKQEYAQVATSGWKQVSVSDICEIARLQVPDKAFSEWLFFNVDKKEHRDYRAVWSLLKSRFADYLEENYESGATRDNP